jgi:hypothetical protein
MIEYVLSEAFNKGDHVKIITPDIRSPYIGIVSKQDHQWLFTSVGVFNITNDKVKAYRAIERYEDHGYC